MVSGPVSLILLAIAVFLIIVGTSRLKISAFLVLILVAYFYGMAIGIPASKVMTVVREGFGGLITKVGLIYLFGTIMGTILEKSGAAVSITNFILKVVGKKHAPLAMAFSGYVVSIPINCDPGFIILTPVNKGLSKETGYSMTTMSVALGGGLLCTHAMVPPTAGPISAAATLNADLAQVILFGLITSFFATIVAWLWATKYCPKYMVKPEGGESYQDIVNQFGKLPHVAHAIAPVIYPLVIICLNSFAQMASRPFGENLFTTILAVLGDPSTALLCSVFIALTLVPLKMLPTAVAQGGWVGDAMKDAALIMFVTAAGGAFGAVLAASPMVGFIEEMAVTWNLGIFLPFIVAAVLKTAQGSSTVSIVTTASIMAPMLGTLGIHPAVATLVIGAGAMVVSHTNDSYFWVVTQFSGFDVDLSLKTYTVMTGLMGIVSFAVLFVINMLV